MTMRRHAFLAEHTHLCNPSRSRNSRSNRSRRHNRSLDTTRIPFLTPTTRTLRIRYTTLRTTPRPRSFKIKTPMRNPPRLLDHRYNRIRRSLVMTLLILTLTRLLPLVHPRLRYRSIPQNRRTHALRRKPTFLPVPNLLLLFVLVFIPV